MTADPREVRRRRGHAQGLAEAPGRPVLETVRGLLAIQAQDFDSARLALRARCPGVTAADIDRAFSERALVISWLCRGTLHLVCAEDFAWLHLLTAPRQLRGNERRLAQEGVSPTEVTAALEVIEASLAGRGPLTRAELRPLITAAGVRTDGQALVHLLVRAALTGRIVRCDGERFALATDWLPRRPPIEREAALRELGRRYRRAHALAGPPDLARWAGVSLGDARVAWRGTSEPDTEARPLPPKLLASFDEYVMGWRERDFAVPDRLRPQVFAGGIIRGVALADGEVVGTWTKPGGRVRRTGPLDGSDGFDGFDGFDREVRDVERFLAGR